MEVRFENGLASNGWMFDRVNGLFREFDGRTRNMVPTVDVTEDKDAYHFYFEMPGLTNESIDARVEDGQLLVAAERKRPEWPNETEVHVAERGYGTIAGRSSCPTTRATTRSRPATRTACSR